MNGMKFEVVGYLVLEQAPSGVGKSFISVFKKLFVFNRALWKTLMMFLFQVERQRQLAADGVAGPPAQVVRHQEHEGRGSNLQRSQKGSLDDRLASG